MDPRGFTLSQGKCKMMAATQSAVNTLEAVLLVWRALFSILLKESLSNQKTKLLKCLFGFLPTVRSYMIPSAGLQESRMMDFMEPIIPSHFKMIYNMLAEQRETGRDSTQNSTRNAQKG